MPLFSDLLQAMAFCVCTLDYRKKSRVIMKKASSCLKVKWVPVPENHTVLFYFLLPFKKGKKKEFAQEPGAKSVL